METGGAGGWNDGDRALQMQPLHEISTTTDNTESTDNNNNTPPKQQRVFRHHNNTTQNTDLEGEGAAHLTLAHTHNHHNHHHHVRTRTHVYPHNHDIEDDNTSESTGKPSCFAGFLANAEIARHQLHLRAMRHKTVLLVVLPLLCAILLLSVTHTPNPATRWRNAFFVACCIVGYIGLTAKQFHPQRKSCAECISSRFLCASPRARRTAGRVVNACVLTTVVIFVLIVVGRHAQRLRSVLGLVSVLCMCGLWSTHLAKIKLRPVLWGLGLQFLLGLFVMHTSLGFRLFDSLGNSVVRFNEFASEGHTFVFGEWCADSASFRDTNGRSCADLAALQTSSNGTIPFSDGGFCVRENVPSTVEQMRNCPKTCGLCSSVRPFWHISSTIIFFSSMMAVLYHLGIMQSVMMLFTTVFSHTMDLSGAEALVAAANIFVGGTNAPLTIKPYLESLTQSELFVMMCTGFATGSGTVLVAYINLGVDPKHLIAASVMSSPAALVISKIMYPETKEAETKSVHEMHFERQATNLVEAAAKGAMEGMQIVLSMFAGLIGFLGLISCANSLLSVVDLSLPQIFRVVFLPLSWLIGIPNDDCDVVATLLGEKMMFNEFIAYQHMMDGRYGKLSARGQTIATYALCGFANLSSISMQLTAISSICPTRSHDLAREGVRAMVGGFLATCLSASVAALLVED